MYDAMPSAVEMRASAPATTKEDADQEQGERDHRH
jgi:hypothetical protein